jgi:hypothetical protein
MISIISFALISSRIQNDNAQSNNRITGIAKSNPKIEFEARSILLKNRGHYEALWFCDNSQVNCYVTASQLDTTTKYESRESPILKHAAYGGIMRIRSHGYQKTMHAWITRAKSSQAQVHPIGNIYIEIKKQVLILRANTPSIVATRQMGVIRRS